MLEKSLTSWLSSIEATLHVTLRTRSAGTLCRHAASAWGLEVLRYEIRDITPPQSVRHAMDLQAEAERRKRAQVGDGG